MYTKNQIKSVPSNVKNHVHRNRGKYAFAAGAITVFALHRTAVKQWDQFLAEKGIDPLEFYCPEELAEMNQ